MEMNKIHNLSDEEIAAQSNQASEQIFRIRFQKTLGNVEGLKKLAGLKLDVARMKTVQRQRSLAVASTEKPVALAPVASSRTSRKIERKAKV